MLSQRIDVPLWLALTACEMNVVKRENSIPSKYLLLNVDAYFSHTVAAKHLIIREPPFDRDAPKQPLQRTQQKITFDYVPLQ